MKSNPKPRTRKPWSLARVNPGLDKSEVLVSVKSKPRPNGNGSGGVYGDGYGWRSLFESGGTAEIQWMSAKARQAGGEPSTFDNKEEYLHTRNLPVWPYLYQNLCYGHRNSFRYTLAAELILVIVPNDGWATFHIRRLERSSCVASAFSKRVAKSGLLRSEPGWERARLATCVQIPIPPDGRLHHCMSVITFYILDR